MLTGRPLPKDGPSYFGFRTDGSLPDTRRTSSAIRGNLCP